MFNWLNLNIELLSLYYYIIISILWLTSYNIYSWVNKRKKRKKIYHVSSIWSLENCIA